MISVWLPVLVVLCIVGFVGGAVFIIGPAYDKHPWVKALLDSYAAMVPGYYSPPDVPDPRAGLPADYLAKAPGKMDAHV
jgi:hypothetical protein